MSYRLVLRYPDGTEIVTRETEEPLDMGDHVDDSGVTWRVIGVEYGASPPVIQNVHCAIAA